MLYIEGCPIPFHDVHELTEFLLSIHDPVLLYMYQGLGVYVLGHLFMFIVITRFYDAVSGQPFFNRFSISYQRV